MVYFLWSGVFADKITIFDYSRAEMLTYVFLVLVVQSIVFTNPSSDHIGSEISGGHLSNFLLKPLNYINYWFVRDLSGKILNLIFSIFEVGVLWYLLMPAIKLPESVLTYIFFIAACGLAVILYYLLSVSTRFVAFWMPENTWAMAFLSIVLSDIFSGSVFPLNILPAWSQIALQFTPFPYLVYFPISIFVGKITGLFAVQILLQSLLWVVLMHAIAQYIWKKGLKVYSSEGR